MEARLFRRLPGLAVYDRFLVARSAKRPADKAADKTRKPASRRRAPRSAYIQNSRSNSLEEASSLLGWKTWRVRATGRASKDGDQTEGKVSLNRHAEIAEERSSRRSVQE